MSQRPDRAEQGDDRSEVAVATGRSAAPAVSRPDGESVEAVRLGPGFGEQPRDSTPLSRRSEREIERLEPSTDE